MENKSDLNHSDNAQVLKQLMQCPNTNMTNIKSEKSEVEEEAKQK